MRYQLGLPPWDPDTKGFSGKVLWNLKGFRRNECVYSVRSSLAYLSFKKGKRSSNY